jgi:hypothetical protein
MIIEYIELKIGKSLPLSYKNLLRGINDYCYINYNEFRDEFPDDSGVAWFFWSEERLNEPVVIDGATENRKAWEILRSYKEIKNVARGTSSDYINFLVSIAEDNGDILYMDARDNFSVWIYLHDSGESKRLEDNFDAWMANASIN